MTDNPKPIETLVSEMKAAAEAATRLKAMIAREPPRVVNEDIRILLASHTDLMGHAAFLEKQNAAMQDINAVQAAEMMQLRSDIDWCDANRTQNLEWANRTEAQISTLSAKLVEATEEITVLRDSADVLTEEIVAQSDLITGLDARLVEAQEQIIDLKREVRDADAGISMLAIERREAWAKLVELEQEIEHYVLENQQLHDVHMAARKALAEKLVESEAREGALTAKVERLSAMINTPEIVDFIGGVHLEAVHQRERWGASHDVGKAPLDWFWLIGYLAQKAAAAHMSGDADKALHHTISTAAALANWHAAIIGSNTSMRPGIDPSALLLADTKEPSDDR